MNIYSTVALLLMLFVQMSEVPSGHARKKNGEIFLVDRITGTRKNSSSGIVEYTVVAKDAIQGGRPAWLPSINVALDVVQRHLAL